MSRTATASATTALAKVHLRSNHIRPTTAPTISTARSLISEHNALPSRDVPLRKNSLQSPTFPAGKGLQRHYSTSAECLRDPTQALVEMEALYPGLCGSHIWKRRGGWRTARGIMGEGPRWCCTGNLVLVRQKRDRAKVPAFILVCRQGRPCDPSPKDLVHSVA